MTLINFAQREWCLLTHHLHHVPYILLLPGGFGHIVLDMVKSPRHMGQSHFLLCPPVWLQLRITSVLHRNNDHRKSMMHSQNF